jgi:uncharacterized Tic20 family protein
MSVAAPAASCCCPVGSGVKPGGEGLAISISLPVVDCCGPGRPEPEHEPAPAPAPEAPAEPLELTITNRGRIRQEDICSTDRNLAVMIHLISLPAFVVLGPLCGLATLALWLAGRDRSVFVDEHGREAVNFHLSLFLYHILLAVTIVGIILFPILWIVAIVSQIRGALAANGSEYFRYPMIIRFLS